MDIENEIQVLRDQLAEKASDSLHLLKEVYVFQIHLNQIVHVILCSL